MSRIKSPSHDNFLLTYYVKITIKRLLMFNTFFKPKHAKNENECICVTCQSLDLFEKTFFCQHLEKLRKSSLFLHFPTTKFWPDNSIFSPFCELCSFKIQSRWAQPSQSYKYSLISPLRSNFYLDEYSVRKIINALNTHFSDQGWVIYRILFSNLWVFHISIQCYYLFYMGS